MWAAGESVLSIQPPEVRSLLRSSSCLVVFVFFLVFRAGLITTCTEEAELQSSSATGCSSSLQVLLSLFVPIVSKPTLLYLYNLHPGVIKRIR